MEIMKHAAASLRNVDVHFGGRAGAVESGFAERVNAMLGRFGIDPNAPEQSLPAEPPLPQQGQPAIAVGYDRNGRAETERQRQKEELTQLLRALETLRKLLDRDEQDESEGTGNVVYNPLVFGSGDGNDLLHVYANAIGHTGGGDDIVHAYHNSTIMMGDGNDVAHAYGNSTIDLGDGNNSALMYANSTVSSNGGNDEFLLLGNGQVNAGAGNDTILMTANGTADGGAGDDYIESSANATGYGGEGNDVLISHGNGTIHGGAGDDALTITSFQGKATGGTGDDVITASSGGAVSYDAGDGHDVLQGNYGGTGKMNFRTPNGQEFSHRVGAVTVSLGGGITAGQVRAERIGGDVRLSFAGIEGSITLKDYQGKAPALRFADGSQLDLDDIIPSAIDIVA